MKIKLKKSYIFKASIIRTRNSGQHREEGGSFKKQCGCLTHVDNDKTILRKVSSSIKRLNTYQELVAKKLINVQAKHICSGCLKQNVISESETLPDVESQINVSIFFCDFEINQVIEPWGNSSIDSLFSSRFTFKLRFRFKRAFLLNIFKSFVLFSPLLKTPQKMTTFLH